VYDIEEHQEAKKLILILFSDCRYGDKNPSFEQQFVEFRLNSLAHLACDINDDCTFI
jgi:hypothetical protein